MRTPSVTRGFGFLEKTLARWRARKADSQIPDALRAGRILDIGCGHFPFFLSTTEFAEKHGLERLEPSRAAAIGTEHGIVLNDFDLEKNERLPFDDGYFDVVTLLAVIEHIASGTAVQLLREVHRVISPRGGGASSRPQPRGQTVS